MRRYGGAPSSSSRVISRTRCCSKVHGLAREQRRGEDVHPTAADSACRSRRYTGLRRPRRPDVLDRRDDDQERRAPAASTRTGRRCPRPDASPADQLPQPRRRRRSRRTRPSRRNGTRGDRPQMDGGGRAAARRGRHHDGCDDGGDLGRPVPSPARTATARRPVTRTDHRSSAWPPRRAVRPGRPAPQPLPAAPAPRRAARSRRDPARPRRRPGRARRPGRPRCPASGPGVAPGRPRVRAARSSTAPDDEEEPEGPEQQPCPGGIQDGDDGHRDHGEAERQPLRPGPPGRLGSASAVRIPVPPFATWAFSPIAPSLGGRGDDALCNPRPPSVLP